MLTVAPVSATAARYAVLHWHYSRKMPVGRNAKLGVWEDDRYVGVIMFGRGASRHLGARYGFTPFEVCELVRVALRSHTAPVSQIVALAVTQVRQASPATRVVFSFADPYHGHHGGIYQAMNWLYLGETPHTIKFRTPTGELLHSRVVEARRPIRQFGRLTPAVRRELCEKVVLPGRHRYALPLDRGARRTLLPHSEPYPPRGGSVDGDTPGNRSESQVRPLGTAPR